MQIGIEYIVFVRTENIEFDRINYDDFFKNSCWHTDVIVVNGIYVWYGISITKQMSNRYIQYKYAVNFARSPL